jgi:hypothetical protein
MRTGTGWLLPSMKVQPIDVFSGQAADEEAIGVGRLAAGGAAKKMAVQRQLLLTGAEKWFTQRKETLFCRFRR